MWVVAGGGGPPGGPGFDDPKSSGNTVVGNNQSDSVIKTCNEPEDPAELPDINVIGVSGGIRNWLSGSSRAWAIIGNYAGGAGALGLVAPGIPILIQPPEPHRAECSDDIQGRADHANRAVALEQARRLSFPPRPILQSGNIVSVRFSGGGSESYTVVAPLATLPVIQIAGTLVCN